MSSTTDQQHLAATVREELRQPWSRSPVRPLVPEPLSRAIAARSVLRHLKAGEQADRVVARPRPTVDR